MAKVFKNQAELHKFMLEECKNAAEKIAEDVKGLITDFIMVYYSEFTPKYYDRTYSFLSSVTTTKAARDGNGYKVYVYLDDTGVYYEDVEPVDVWNYANEGLHGGYPLSNGKPSNVHFWDDAMEMLDKGYIIKKFGDYLKDKGFSVTIKH